MEGLEEIEEGVADGVERIAEGLEEIVEGMDEIALEVEENILDDLEEEWVYSQKFDYIHVRYLACSIRDWPKLMRQCYKLVFLS